MLQRLKSENPVNIMQYSCKGLCTYLLPNRISLNERFIANCLRKSFKIIDISCLVNNPCILVMIKIIHQINQGNNTAPSLNDLMFKFYIEIRKHYNRMCIARVPAIQSDVSTVGLGCSSNEHVWTGLQWWPQDVSSRGWGQGVPHLMVWYLGGAGLGGGGALQWGPVHHG